MKLKKKGENVSLEVKEEKTYSSLTDVMDYSREFSLFFSGVENDTYFQGCYDMGIRDFLMSYHYLQKSKIPMHAKYSGLGIKFFIDSGAHTYQNDPKYLDVGVDYWEEHIKRYLNWAEDNSDFIFAIANCDFENLVGGEKVLEWNEKYFEPFMLRTGIPVCFVWHQDSIRTWEQYCQRYPYVGFSSVNTEGENIEMNEYINTLKIAEKYNTLVHGFGMTRTSMLPKLPFYTVDSTSWKAGFMYGQLAFWNGKKVQMLRKEEFERAFKYIRMYDINPPIDEKLIYDYYEPEVLRANVHAYKLAVEFIRNALKSLTYWKKAKTQQRTIEDLKDFKYPTVSKLQNIEQNWKELAPRLNISTEDSEAKLIQNTIVDLTCFMNWDVLKYQGYIKQVYTPEVINEVHTKWINRIVNTDEEKIEDLKRFFTDVLLGENDKLLLIGTNFDRIVKERDEYITDEEYEEIDLDDSEIYKALDKYLPAPSEDGRAPEIDELDDEIFSEAGIVPVRDDNGHFLKGQRRVLKPKKMYSNKYPKMACDMCFNAQKCPEYKAGYVCAYNKMFDRYDTRDMGDIIQAMQGIAEYQIVRTQRAMLTETMNGGMPDANTTAMMNQAMAMMNNLKAMYDMASREVIRQTKVVRADGTQEMSTSISNPQSGGVLERLFSNLGSDEKEEPKDETPKEEGAKEVVDVEIVDKEDLFLTEED